MIIRTVLILFILASSSAWGARFAESEAGDAFSYGAFRLNPGYGYLGLQNQDGSRAVFGGPLIAAEFDVVFTFVDANLALGPFLHYSRSFQKNLRVDGDYSQELTKSDLMYGLKAYISPFFIGFAFGETTLQLTQTGGRQVDIYSTQLGFLGGLRLFKIGNNMNISFEGWYKSSFLKKSTNPTLNQNTAAEGMEFYLNFVWSPLFQLL